ncbi:MAG: serine/threonine-protein kinase [Cyanobacteria bacterium P01_E01_bin.34]
MQTCHCLNPDCQQPHNPTDAKRCGTCGSALLLRGRYRAYKRLGQGGFGTTFLARDLDMPSQPWRVIKQLRVAEASEQVAQLSKELFMREAQVLEKLGEHSQIPTLYAYFGENNRFYLVQEFVLGTTLSSEAHRNGAFSGEQIQQVLREVSLILSYVHSKNTVHRDIKPANLIRRKDDGRLVLIDFGAVKQMGIAGMEEMPSTVTAIRSLGFSPPEQMTGHAVGPASDLYALAATCINLLTRKSPNRFFDTKRNCWTWQDELELDERLTSILERMLHPSMSERYESATAVLRSLQESSSIGMGAGSRPQPQVAAQPATVGSNPISRNWSYRVGDTGFTPISPYRQEQPSARSATLKVAPASNRPSSYRPATPEPRSPANRPAPTPVPSMEGADLSNRNMAKESLAGANLRKANLMGTNLSGADLRGADLRGASYTGPPPKWKFVLARVFWMLRTLAGMVGGVLCLMLAAGGAGWGIYKLTSNLWLGAIGGLLATIWSGWYVWQFTERRLGTAIVVADYPQRYTLLKGADLRKAKLDSGLRAHAKQQGARLG